MRFYITALLLLLFASTASAHSDCYERSHYTATEAQLGAVLGGGWFDMSAGSVETSRDMGATVGGTARLGFAVPMHSTMGLVLALHGDVLSMSEARNRFFVTDGAGFLGVRFHLLNDCSSFLLGGLLGLAGSEHPTLQSSTGLTYGGVIGYRYEHLFLEARYQVFAFDTRVRVVNGLDVPYADVAIRQFLFSAGFAL